MSYKLLVDSEEFTDALYRDLSKAKKRIKIQMMTYEGDNSGLELSRNIMASKALKKNILVDSFTKYMLSDKFVYFPTNLLNRELREEKLNTEKMFADMQDAGIKIKWTNPPGFLLHKFPSRNHKKIYVVDDISYIGGINFSDHNLSWHDMMIRIEDREITEFLNSDFTNTWAKGSLYNRKKTADTRIISFDGKSNIRGFREILDLIEKAEKEILVISPYLSFPFTDSLKSAAAKGVKVQIITPENNNRQSIKKFLEYEFSETDAELYLYPENMVHLKAICIDKKFLICGSSNFDYISYKAEEEIVAVFDNEELIRDFYIKVAVPDLAKSALSQGEYRKNKKTVYRKFLKLTADIVTFISHL